MAFPITCDSCGKQSTIPDDIYERRVAGRVVTIRCKQCKADIKIDGRSAAAKAATPDAPVERATNVDAESAAPPVAAPAATPAAETKELAAPAATKHEVQPAEAKPAPAPAHPAAAPQTEPNAEAVPARPEAGSKLDSQPKVEARSKLDSQPKPESSPKAAQRPKLESKPKLEPRLKQESQSRITPTPAIPTAAGQRVTPAQPLARPQLDSRPRVTPTPAVPASRPQTAPTPVAASRDSRPRMAIPGAMQARAASGAVGTEAALGSATPAKAPPVQAAPTPMAAPVAGQPLAVKPAQPQQQPATLGSVPPTSSWPPSGSPSDPPIDALWAVDFGTEDRELTAAQIGEELRRGSIDAETLVWHIGMDDWLPIAQVPDLAALLGGQSQPAAQPTAASSNGGSAVPASAITPPVPAGTSPASPSPAPAVTRAIAAAVSDEELESLQRAQKRRRLLLLIGVAALAAVLLIVVVILATSGSKDPEQTMTAPMPPAADETSQGRQPQAAPAEQPAAPAGQESLPSPTTGARGDKGFLEMFAAAADDSAGPTGTKPFDRRTAVAAVQSKADHIAGCRRRIDPSGDVKTEITFAPNGRITKVVVVNRPYQTGHVATCVTKILKAVRIPPFSGEAATVKTSFPLR